MELTQMKKGCETLVYHILLYMILFMVNPAEYPILTNHITNNIISQNKYCILRFRFRNTHYNINVHFQFQIICVVDLFRNIVNQTYYFNSIIIYDINNIHFAFYSKS